MRTFTKFQNNAPFNGSGKYKINSMPPRKLFIIDTMS